MIIESADEIRLIEKYREIVQKIEELKINGSEVTRSTSLPVNGGSDGTKHISVGLRWVRAKAD